ncbi:LysR family transcriptional regulator [Chromohalobacter nigrandesensis]|uniref:LysR family transcriptional regulator n=1 Tax=Chromohalobacter nigrandesensis TaxID=119863 RepID=UPI001FF3645B|nr:LysR family transcriptional regulator [Chromohalobacter nigrandesensis]MCK0744065.1 LysR family transcriptional regulator [Chromohalobacter nigrandesensis]
MIRSLDALRVFVEVARAQSMTVAADRLFVTPGAVSKRVRELERDLGATLFDREHHTVRLTAKGAELYRVSQNLFDTLSSALTTFDQDVDTDIPLVVSCEPTITMQWLIPRLPDFYALHPNITLHLLAAGGPVDFQSTSIDLALRRDDFSWGPGVFACRVADEITGVVASPSMANSDREVVTILHTASRSSAWRPWRARFLSQARIDRELEFEHFYLSLKAARAGLGYAIGSIYMVADQTVSGELEAPMGFIADGSSYWLLSASCIESDERKRAFCSWLIEALAQTATAASVQ